MNHPEVHSPRPAAPETQNIGEYNATSVDPGEPLHQTIKNKLYKIAATACSLPSRLVEALASCVIGSPQERAQTTISRYCQNIDKILALKNSTEQINALQTELGALAQYVSQGREIRLPVLHKTYDRQLTAMSFSTLCTLAHALETLHGTATAQDPVIVQMRSTLIERLNAQALTRPGLMEKFAKRIAEYRSMLGSAARHTRSSDTISAFDPRYVLHDFKHTLYPLFDETLASPHTVHLGYTVIQRILNHAYERDYSNPMECMTYQLFISQSMAWLPHKDIEGLDKARRAAVNWHNQGEITFNDIIKKLFATYGSRQQAAGRGLMAQLQEQCQELDNITHPYALNDPNYENMLRKTILTLMTLQAQGKQVNMTELAGYESRLIEKSAALLTQALDTAKAIDAATSESASSDALIHTFTELLKTLEKTERFSQSLPDSLSQVAIAGLQRKIVEHAIKVQSQDALQAFTGSTFQNTMIALRKTLEDAHEQSTNGISWATYDRRHGFILHSHLARLVLLDTAIQQVTKDRNSVAPSHNHRHTLSDKVIFPILRQSVGTQLDRDRDGTLHISASPVRLEFAQALLTELKKQIPDQTEINDDHYIRDMLDRLSDACVDDVSWKQIMAWAWTSGPEITHDAQSHILALIQQGASPYNETLNATQELTTKFKSIHYDVQRLALVLVTKVLPRLFLDVIAEKPQWLQGTQHAEQIMSHRSDSRKLSFKFTPDEVGGVVISMDDYRKNGEELIDPADTDLHIGQQHTDPAQDAIKRTQKLNPMGSEQRLLMNFHIRPDKTVFDGPISYSKSANLVR